MFHIFWALWHDCLSKPTNTHRFHCTPGTCWSASRGWAPSGRFPQRMVVGEGLDRGEDLVVSRVLGGDPAGLAARVIYRVFACPAQSSPWLIYHGLLGHPTTAIIHRQNGHGPTPILSKKINWKNCPSLKLFSWYCFSCVTYPGKSWKERGLLKSCSNFY